MWSALSEYISSRAAYWRTKEYAIKNPEPAPEGFAARLTAIGTCLGAVLAGIAAFVFLCQLQTMNNAYIAANPPKLKAVNFFVDKTAFKPGQKISGYAYVVNVGRGTADVGDIFCITYWVTGQLPMNRPYFGDLKKLPNGHQCDSPRQIDGANHYVAVSPLKAGNTVQWQFTDTVPSGYTESESLYVMGTIKYRDGLGTQRWFIFARKYDPSLGRFVPSDNPDYDSSADGNEAQ